MATTQRGFGLVITARIALPLGHPKYKAIAAITDEEEQCRMLEALLISAIKHRTVPIVLAAIEGFYEGEFAPMNPPARPRPKD